MINKEVYKTYANCVAASIYGRKNPWRAYFPQPVLDKHVIKRFKDAVLLDETKVRADLLKDITPKPFNQYKNIEYVEPEELAHIILNPEEYAISIGKHGYSVRPWIDDAIINFSEDLANRFQWLVQALLCGGYDSTELYEPTCKPAIAFLEAIKNNQTPEQFKESLPQYLGLDTEFDKIIEHLLKK